MATWSELETGLTITELCATDGINLYWVSNNTDIYKYNVSTDTVTQIADNGSWSATDFYIGINNSACNLVWFNGALYAAGTNPGVTSHAFEIYRYSGSGTAWTRVFQSVSASEYEAVLLMSGAGYIVAGKQTGFTGVGYHSTDGTNWSASTLPGSWGWDNPGVFFGNDTRFAMLSYGTTGGAQRHIAQFDTGTWSIVETFANNQTGLVTAHIDRSWKYNSSTGYRWTTDFSTYNTPADNRPPVQSYNMPYPVGYVFASGEIYYMPFGTEWTTTPETVVPGELMHILRTNDGNVYLLTEDTIWGRSEPILTGLSFQDADIDASGDHLYIGVLNGGIPQILKMSTALDEDATVDYNPGAGTEVHLMAGSLQDNKVWAVGDFGSSYVVQLDWVNGIYWYTDSESIYWYGPVRPLLVGPNDDNLVLVALPNAGDLYESFFEVNSLYPTWQQRNSNLPFEVSAMARLSTNPDDVMIGSYWYTGLDEMVAYSPNGGLSFETVIDDIPAAITGVLFGEFA